MAFYVGVTALVDEGKATDVIYLDLTKAFDMVPPPHPYLQIGGMWIRWVDHSLDKKLVERPQTEGGDQWFYVQVEAGNEWSPPGVCLGTGAL